MGHGPCTIDGIVKLDNKCQYLLKSRPEIFGNLNSFKPTLVHSTKRYFNSQHENGRCCHENMFDLDLWPFD
jgi:hypothetical protein